MTNSKDVLPQYRDQLELEIKVTFQWASVQSASTDDENGERTGT